jgi:hypothetical protein
MVDEKHIELLLRQHFKVTGSVSISDQHKVSTSGDVQLMSHMPQLPVQFDHVGGKFTCNGKGVTSLQGAPHTVGGDFWCSNNQLTSLEGSAHTVGGTYWCSGNPITNLQGSPTRVAGSFWCAACPLTSLDGAPTRVGVDFWLDYSPDLPLLRLLNYAQFSIQNAPTTLAQIMKKYRGQGQAGAIKAAVDLIREGKKIQDQKGLSENPFKKNARW